MSVNTKTKLIRMTIASDPRHICVARSAIETFVSREGLGEDDVGRIGLAVNEALANVIEHAYDGDTGQTIDISMGIVDVEGRRAMMLTVTDSGKQVERECIKSRDLEDIRPGGLGVHIIQTIMDQVQYRCLDGCGTELTMVKFLDALAE